MKKMLVITVIVISDFCLAGGRSIVTAPIHIIASTDFRKDFSSGEFLDPCLANDNTHPGKTPCNYSGQAVGGAIVAADQWRLSAPPPAATFPDGGWTGKLPYVGIRIVVEITLSLVGADPASGNQTGYVTWNNEDPDSATPLSLNQIRAYASYRNTKMSTTYYYDRQVYLCGGSSSGSSIKQDYRPSTIDANVLGMKANFSLSKNNPTASVRAIARFTGRFDPRSGITGFGGPSAYAEFTPAFRIHVDQDPGAIIAQMNYMVGIPYTVTGNTFCFGLDSGASILAPDILAYPGYFQPPVPIPYYINGGRPF